MINCVFPHGSGDAWEAAEYLMSSVDHTRAKRNVAPEVLVGDPFSVAKIANALTYKQKYTSGVLSFIEKNISCDVLHQIANSHAAATFPGLERDRIAVSYVIHRDKKITELHYLFANTDLAKALTLKPYCHRFDLSRMNLWKDAINYKFSLESPMLQRRARLTRVSNRLPMKKRKLVETVEEHILRLVAAEVLLTRDDVINYWRNAVFADVTEVSDKSIKIQIGGDVPFILRGWLYEKFRRFDLSIGKLLEQVDESAPEWCPENTEQFVTLCERRARYLFERNGGDGLTLEESCAKAREESRWCCERADRSSAEKSPAEVEADRKHSAGCEAVSQRAARERHGQLADASSPSIPPLINAEGGASEQVSKGKELPPECGTELGSPVRSARPPSMA